jgi:hypothetical protein
VLKTSVASGFSRTDVLATGFVAGAFALLLAIPTAAQDGDRSAARNLVMKWERAIVNVRVVLKMRMSVGGREMQSMDDSVETVGTVIDPSGLTVMSLGSLNPGAMMNRLMGSASSGQEKMEFGSEPTEVKMRLADGREIPAKIVLRDEDLDLAFIRPTVKPDKPLVAVNLADAVKPALLDQIVVLSRLGRVGGWAPSASLQNVEAIIERPRTFFVADMGTPSSPMGIPAFTTSGKIVGLLTLRTVASGRSSMFAGMSGTEGLGMLQVILPAADILEIARQAMDK